MPPLKRQHTTGSESKLPKKRGVRNTVLGTVGDRENLTMPNLSSSTGPGSGMGRRLRSREGSGS